VHAEAAVVARAGEADEEAEFGGCPSEEGALGVGLGSGEGAGTVGRGRRSRRRGCWRGAFGGRAAEGEGWSKFLCMIWGVGGRYLAFGFGVDFPHCGRSRGGFPN